MGVNKWKLLILGLALTMPAAAPAQSADFSRMWTGWKKANADSSERERVAQEKLKRDLASADQARLAQLRDSGRDLGERVGAVVREGDCAEGERMALDAKDYALVEAVRAYCSPSKP